MPWQQAVSPLSLREDHSNIHQVSWQLPACKLAAGSWQLAAGACHCKPGSWQWAAASQQCIQQLPVCQLAPGMIRCLCLVAAMCFTIFSLASCKGECLNCSLHCCGQTLRKEALPQNAPSKGSSRHPARSPRTTGSITISVKQALPLSHYDEARSFSCRKWNRCRTGQRSGLHGGIQRKTSGLNHTWKHRAWVASWPGQGTVQLAWAWWTSEGA